MNPSVTNDQGYNLYYPSLDGTRSEDEFISMGLKFYGPEEHYRVLQDMMSCFKGESASVTLSYVCKAILNQKKIANLQTDYNKIIESMISKRSWEDVCIAAESYLKYCINPNAEDEGKYIDLVMSINCEGVGEYIPLQERIDGLKKLENELKNKLHHLNDSNKDNVVNILGDLFFNRDMIKSIRSYYQDIELELYRGRFEYIYREAIDVTLSKIIGEKYIGSTLEEQIMKTVKELLLSTKEGNDFQLKAILGGIQSSSDAA